MTHSISLSISLTGCPSLSHSFAFVVCLVSISHLVVLLVRVFVVYFVAGGGVVVATKKKAVMLVG
jgi:hypothetical protein